MVIKKIPSSLFILVLIIIFCGESAGAGDYDGMRNSMVENQIRARAVRDKDVLEAMKKSPPPQICS